MSNRSCICLPRKPPELSGSCPGNPRPKECTVSDELITCVGEHPTQHPAQEHLIDPETAREVARLFSALADPTRARIIGLLANAELCVGDLHRLLGMTQPAVSHQLRLLRDLRLVKARKEGRHVYYSLDDEHVYRLFQEGLDHVRHG